MEVGETLTVRGRAQWRRWLAKHHADKKEIWLVYFRKTAGKSGIGYDEAVEEALAYGWIDGQIKGIDDMRYAGRFTPRRPGSNWSVSNMERVKRLVKEGRMAAPGLAVIPKELIVSLPLRERVREGAARRVRRSP